MNKALQKTVVFLLCALFCFLPFSSLLVSLTGKPSVSIVRDIIIITISIIVIFAYRKKVFSSKMSLLILGFIALGTLSYFWREASLLQWLRGARFTFMPILLYFALIQIEFSEQEKKAVGWAVLIGATILGAIAVFEFFGVRIPLSGVGEGVGSISTIHFIEGSEFVRLQSILAGPNAFGLYLLAICAYAAGVFKFVNSKAVYLIPLFMLFLALTYSRSSILGLVVLLFTALLIYSREKYGLAKSSGWALTVLFLVLIFLYFGSNQKKYEVLFTHGGSSEARMQQYRRVWDQKYEIGLLGRGAGTAGPSSQNRLDNGPNHWTENIYLDIFEEYGLVGLLIYLAIIITLVGKSWGARSSSEGKTALLINLSFAFSGLFINYYTGQVAVYLLWLANGLLPNVLPSANLKERLKGVL